MIFSCENVLVLAMIWILSPVRVIWPYSVLPVHSQVLTFLTTYLMIPSKLAISLFIVAGCSSTHVISRWLYRRNIVVDGNFSLEHMKMKKPGHDVFLNDGCGYLVDSARYQEHLESSRERTQVSISCATRSHSLYSVFAAQRSSCANHKAINQANSNSKNLQATGVGACACARHGCFLPHSVVDFQKGERSDYPFQFSYDYLNSTRHMNIDYSICQALGHNSCGLHEALIVYDVACQWSIHFEERVDESGYLNLPEGLKYIPAVGKFHLAAHVEGCFAQFSLNFVQGAGQQDGEVLETLWSGLNKAAGSTRAMTKPHRQEMLDAHILDSNWKKHVNMGMVLFDHEKPSMVISQFIVKSLKRKVAKALPAMQESLEVFQELDQSIDPQTRKKWQAQEDMAMEFRGDYLSVYNVKLEKGD
jgi:hypothetical protein